MTFNNRPQILNFRIILFIATVLLLAWLAIAYLIKLVRFPLLGLSDTVCTLILIVIYLIIVLWPIILNYQFVFFSDDGDNILFRYFNTGIIGGKKNSIEIDKKTFAGFKTESRYFGLMQSLILFQRVGQKIAKYPPVYISALDKEQRKKVFSSLGMYARGM
jgi:hypothetical protein